MSNNRIIKIIAILVLILSTVASFGPCWHVNSWLGIAGGSEHYNSHFGLIFLIISIVEIIILLAAKGKIIVFCGIVLQVIKTFLPCVGYPYFAKLEGQCSITLTKLGKMMFVFAIIMVILHFVIFILEITSKINESKGPLPLEDISNMESSDEK